MTEINIKQWNLVTDMTKHASAEVLFEILQIWDKYKNQPGNGDILKQLQKSIQLILRQLVKINPTFVSVKAQKIALKNQIFNLPHQDQSTLYHGHIQIKDNLSMKPHEEIIEDKLSSSGKRYITPGVYDNKIRAKDTLFFLEHAYPIKDMEEDLINLIASKQLTVENIMTIIQKHTVIWIDRQSEVHAINKIATTGRKDNWLQVYHEANVPIIKITPEQWNQPMTKKHFINPNSIISF